MGCAACRRVVQKKIPETDAIFEQLAQLHAQARQDDSILRISMDAKATISVGWFSRGGRSRVIVKALDHDFKPEQTLTPYGMFLPEYDELYLYFTTGRVTSDFIVDCLEDFWRTVQERFPQVKTLLINQDNGPENHSRRTQFMQRITDFVDAFHIEVLLAYYPPYHSKYNPIERVWGVVEKRWNGSLLDTVETVLNFAKNLIWKGVSPQLVKLVTKPYATGMRLTQKAMAILEQRFVRLPGLEKWFVRIASLAA
jgi:transposase